MVGLASPFYTEEARRSAWLVAGEWLRAIYPTLALGLFVQADTIVPQPGNSQALNRYAYTYNNPLKYTDPSGHCPGLLIFACGYAALRVAVEVGMEVIPAGKEMRQHQVSDALLTRTSGMISNQAGAAGVDAAVVGSILYGENMAFERRLLTPLPFGEPRRLASAAENIEARIRGGRASIGPAQMQLRRAEELESLGYVTRRSSPDARIGALLSEKGAVEYATGMVTYLSDQLAGAFSNWGQQSAEVQRRILLIGYNMGWDGDQGLRRNIEKWGYGTVIQITDYDDQTLDPYLQWAGAQ